MSVSYGGDSITFADSSVISTGWTGFKNYLINGDIRIDQRYAGSSNNATGGAYVVDRWHHYYSGPTYSTQQSTDAPSGFRNSLLMTNTSASSSPTYCFFGQRIEGLVAAPLQFGTSSAKTITVSFWVKSSVTGIYSISITNGASDRSYTAQYTINSSDTWEQKSMTIPGDTTGTWLTTNANGLYLRFNLGSGDARLQAAGSWGTTNADGATGSTGARSWANTLGATIRFTGIQLEVGSTASSFEFRPYPVELAMCQRYYYRISGNGAGIATIAGNGTASAGTTLWFPVMMRSSPSWSSSGLTLYAYTSGSISNFDSFYIYTASPTSVRLVWNGSGITSGLTLGDVNCNGANAFAAFSSEL